MHRYSDKISKTTENADGRPDCGRVENATFHLHPQNPTHPHLTSTYKTSCAQHYPSPATDIRLLPPPPPADTCICVCTTTWDPRPSSVRSDSLPPLLLSDAPGETVSMQRYVPHRICAVPVAVIKEEEVSGSTADLPPPGIAGAGGTVTVDNGEVGVDEVGDGPGVETESDSGDSAGEASLSRLNSFTSLLEVRRWW